MHLGEYRTAKASLQSNWMNALLLYKFSKQHDMHLWKKEDNKEEEKNTNR